jgi:rubrerythrin
MSTLKNLSINIKKSNEKIRQIENNIKNIEYCISNDIFINILKTNKEKYNLLLDFSADFEFVIDEYKKSNLYPTFNDTKEKMSDGYIRHLLHSFTDDVSVYSAKTLYRECKGDLHCVTGNDGNLQYIHICSDCGTIIIDDHSAEYQFECPTLLCPTCNELKENSKYPFQYITRQNEGWISRVHYYSMLVKKQLLSDKELDELINSLKHIKDSKGIIKKYKQYKFKRFFKKEVNKKFVPMDYIAGTDMSNVELKYLKEK